MARGTHVRTFRRPCGSYPLAGDPAARSRSALQALENPRHCSHSCSPLREAVRALHFSQLPLGPLRELRFYIVCSYQENLFSWFRGSAGPHSGSHSAALCDRAHAERWEELRSKKSQTQEGPLRGIQERKRQPAAVRHGINIWSAVPGGGHTKCQPGSKRQLFPSLKRPGCILSF